MLKIKVKLNTEELNFEQLTESVLKTKLLKQGWNVEGTHFIKKERSVYVGIKYITTHLFVDDFKKKHRCVLNEAIKQQLKHDGLDVRNLKITIF